MSASCCSVSLQVHLLQVLFQPLFYGTVTPLLAWFAVKKFILDPWEAKKKQKAKEEEKMEKMSRYFLSKKLILRFKSISHYKIPSFEFPALFICWSGPSKVREIQNSVNKNLQ